MTLVPRFSRLALGAFELAFRPFQRLRLHTVIYAPDAFRLPEDRPVVMVANHVSWWDGFLLRDLHRAIAPERPLFTLMLERELARFPFFRALGALPFSSRPAAVLRAFRALERRRVADPRFCIAYFPQGEIRPSWQRPLAFERGIELLIERLAPCTVLPVALHVEPLNRVRPTAFVHAGPALYAGAAIRAADVEGRVRLLLDQLLAHVAEHGENAARETPRLLPPRSFAPPTPTAGS